MDNEILEIVSNRSSLANLLSLICHNLASYTHVTIFTSLEKDTFIENIDLYSSYKCLVHNLDLDLIR